MKKRILFFVVIFSVASFAQDNDWKFSGQIQLRSELDGRDFRHRTHPLTFASLRTRVGVEKTFMDKVNFFVQIQDSRVFGEEGNTLAAIDNIDLHQGYVTLKQLFDWNMDVQAGRFEAAYGTERFFGAVGWHYIGRSWDGVRLKIYPGFKLDLFALTHTESVSYIGNATPGTYSFPQMPTPSYSVYGFWESADFNQANRLDLFGYYEINRTKVNNNDPALDRFTVGLNHFGNYNSISTILEGAYQFGGMGVIDAGAYLVSAQGNYQTDGFKFGLGADILSGTESGSDKLKTFAPSFGTNHKFYGYMDYFINIPNNTFNLGLNDFYFTALYSPADCDWSYGLNVHHFMSNQPLNHTPVNSSDANELSAFGQEIDLTIKYNFVKGTSITWGGSAFIPGDLMRLIFIPGNDVGFWSYVMITANL